MSSGRTFDFANKFLPDGLSKVGELDFLHPAQARFMSQVQGRTYANMFRLVERFIGAKSIELGRDHALGDQVALEAIVRLTDEELKHQEMFRRLELMAASGMPAGYSFLPDPNEVAGVVLGKSTWAVLARRRLEYSRRTTAQHRADENLSSCGRTCSLHWRKNRDASSMSSSGPGDAQVSERARTGVAT